MTFINSFLYNNYKSDEGWKKQLEFHNQLIKLEKNTIFSAEKYQQLIVDQTDYILDDINKKSQLISLGIFSCFVSGLLGIYFGFQAFDRKKYLYYKNRKY